MASVRSEEHSFISAVRDETVTAKVGIGSTDGIDLGPKVARWPEKWRNSGKAKPGVDTYKHVARQRSQPFEDGDPRPDTAGGQDQPRRFAARFTFGDLHRAMPAADRPRPVDADEPAEPQPRAFSCAIEARRAQTRSTRTAMRSRSAVSSRTRTPGQPT